MPSREGRGVTLLFHNYKMFILTLAQNMTFTHFLQQHFQTTAARRPVTPAWLIDYFPHIWHTSESAHQSPQQVGSENFGGGWGESRQQPQHGKEVCFWLCASYRAWQRETCSWMEAMFYSSMWYIYLVVYTTLQLITCSYFFQMLYSAGFVLNKWCVGGKKAERDPLLLPRDYVECIKSIIKN